MPRAPGKEGPGASQPSPKHGTLGSCKFEQVPEAQRWPLWGQELLWAGLGEAARPGSLGTASLLSSAGEARRALQAPAQALGPSLILTPSRGWWWGD